MPTLSSTNYSLIERMATADSLFETAGRFQVWGYKNIAMAARERADWMYAGMEDNGKDEKYWQLIKDTKQWLIDNPEEIEGDEEPA